MLLCYNTIMPNQFTHPWTSKEIRYLEKNIKKFTYNQMGSVINRSYSTIQSKIRHLPFQKKIKKHSVNQNFFQSWSPEMAYTLGLVAADGNICHSGRAHTLHLASDDKDIIEKIKRVMIYEGPIHQKTRDNGKISYSLRICDQVIFKDLQDLRITERKSQTLKPSNVPHKFLNHYLRGYFDGDGSVYATKKSKLTSVWYTASPAMASFLFRCIYRVCPQFKGKVYKLPKRNNFYYQISLGKRDSKLIFRFLYKNATIYMERKYRKFL